MPARQALTAAMTADPGLIVLGEGVGRMGGLLGLTAGLAQRFGEERVRDLPVAERGALAVGTGLAIGGRRVVVELADTGRLLGAFEALTEACAIAQAGVPVPLVVTLPWGGEAGPRVEPAILGLLSGLPGLTLLCPHDNPSAGAVWAQALSGDAPVVVLQPRAIGAGDQGVGLLRAGGHLVFVAFGPGVAAALSAADRLADEGIEAGVFAVSTLSPLAADALGEAIRAVGRVVVAHPNEPDWAERALRLGLSEAFLFLESPPAAAPAEVEALVRAARAAVYF